jgi:hypothetical protein
MTTMNYEVYRDSPGMWNRFFKKERAVLFNLINQNQFEQAIDMQTFLRTEIARKLLREIFLLETNLPLSTIKLLKETIIFIEDLY